MVLYTLNLSICDVMYLTTKNVITKTVKITIKYKYAREKYTYQ